MNRIQGALAWSLVFFCNAILVVASAIGRLMPRRRQRGTRIKLRGGSYRGFKKPDAGRFTRTPVSTRDADPWISKR